MSDASKVRLLICTHCGSVKEMPDYPANAPWNYDEWFGRLIKDHQGPNHPPTTQTVHIAKIDEDKWRDPSAREGVLAKLPEEVGMPGSGTGLGQTYYDLKSTYMEDSFRCWTVEHNRTVNCEDYKSDKKRLYPDTKGDRKELGLDVKGRPNTFLCDFCLTGDTEVVTSRGIFSIKSLVGTSPELLVPFKGKKDSITGRGIFAEAPVRYFGQQKVMKITLNKGLRQKVIFATPEHTWFISTKNPNPDGSRVTRRTTETLAEGAHLLPLKSVSMSERGKEGTQAKEVPFATAQGFVFGDGSHGHNDRRPASLPIYNTDKDSVMLPYFSSCEKVDAYQYGIKYIKIISLPRHWKLLPPIDESRTFLLSWLSGYLAADGTVDKRGHASICSSSKENLEFVRSVASICGIGYGDVRERPLTQGTYPNSSGRWELSLDSADMPDWFWKIEEHKTRVSGRLSKNRREDMWIVKSVEDTGRIEDVYCATVEEVEAFGLAGDILTGNCPYNSVVMQRQRKDKYGYDYTT